MDLVTKDDCREKHHAVDGEIKSLFQQTSNLNTRLSRLEGRTQINAMLGGVIGSGISGIVVGIIIFLLTKR